MEAGQPDMGGGNRLMEENGNSLGRLLIADRSAKPSALKLCGAILFCDFLLAVVYGIVVEGANNNIDAQMNGAPAFVGTMAVLSFFLFFYLRKNLGAVKTSVDVYERGVVISAPVLAPKAKKVHADDPIENRTLLKGEIADCFAKGGRLCVIASDGKRYMLVRMKKADRAADYIKEQIENAQ